MMFSPTTKSPVSPTGSKRGLLSAVSGSSRRGMFFSDAASTSAVTTSMSPEEKELIFKWIMSDECSTLDSIKDKYTNTESFTVASRMFDICKSTESDCLFVEARKEWDPRKLCILAFAHAETAFSSPEMAQTYLKASKRKMVQGPSTGSLGSGLLKINLARNDMTIYSYVMSADCKTEADIEQKFTLRDEIDRAKAMFEVAKDLTPGNMFIEARGKWTEEQLSIVAKEHANRPFLTIENAHGYLELAEKKGVSARSFSNYLPMPAGAPTVLEELAEPAVESSAAAPAPSV